MIVTFEWKTGTPEYTGKYLITDKHGHIDVDYYYTPEHHIDSLSDNGIGWHRHYEEDVMAWCELCDIPSYPNRVNY